MDTRAAQEVKPLHPHPASVIHRYFDFLMEYTYEHPVLASRIVKAVGVGGVLLVLSPWILPRLAISAPLNTTASVIVGTTTAAASYASNFLQHRVFGLPVTDASDAYSPDEFEYQSAKGQLIVADKQMPILRIKADTHTDAGYVEGYMLGESIRINIEKTNFLYPVMTLLLGAPQHVEDIKPYLNPILATIPKEYLDEMHGKVLGYNVWLKENYPQEPLLSFERYLLLQLMPDLHNYNPFVENRFSSHLPSYPRSLGCTTIALRLGQYTFVTRVLDWPSHGVGGKYFLQVDREIAGLPRTIDIGIPLLSGGLTLLNDRGQLYQMNIAYGEKILRPQGMPAVFFNRYCAERADSVDDMQRILEEVKPLGAYHLTASDGKETRSFHFYQSDVIAGEHVVEELDHHHKQPQLMVVANHGLRKKNDVPTVVNHKDSTERKQNIHQLFSHARMQAELQRYIDKQDVDPALTPDDIEHLKELCLQLARVALVCNYESVLCSMYVYFHDALVDASAVTDNLYAQRKELSEFRQLMNPGKN